MLLALDGLFWFALALLSLVYLQRRLHSKIQAILFLLTRDLRLTIALFSLLFLPGVLLHELSHYLMAKALGVRTGRFSLFPRMLSNGQIRLGYVEVGRADTLRGTLIGAAPLLSGLSFVFFITRMMNLAPLWSVLRDGHWSLFWLGIQWLPSIRGFPLWFYLTFAISSTMMPSESDRHNWSSFALLLGGLLLIIVLGGGGHWLVDLMPGLNELLRGASVLLLVSLIVHAVLYPPLWLLHRLIAWGAG